MKILAFGAHPDDLEFACGGLLIKAIREQAEVHMVVCSRGEAGTAGTPEGRQQEAEQAAQLIGATRFRWLDFGGDSHFEYSLANRLTIARLIREVQPDTVLAPFLQANQHPDHRILAELVRDAARLARYGGLEELRDLPPHKIGSLLYYAGTAHHEREFDLLVDVSETRAQWIEAIKAHASQVSNLSYLELVIGRAELFGRMAGVDLALPLWTNDPLLISQVEALKTSARVF